MALLNSLKKTQTRQAIGHVRLEDPSAILKFHIMQNLSSNLLYDNNPKARKIQLHDCAHESV
jgi:hypothetical protein